MAARPRAVPKLRGGRMTGADVAALITAAGGATTAVLGGWALVRRKAGELTKHYESDCEECFTQRRAAYRWIRVLRDLLSKAGIPEPEGIDDELGLSRRAGRDADEAPVA
jgi:hypothetical protein